MIFQKLRKEVIRRINNLYIDTKSVSDEVIYLLCFELIKNEHLTDAFLLSEFGGYTKGQIKEIKKRTNLIV